MDICPNCNNVLEYLLPEGDRPLRLACPACPYVQYIESNKKMEVDDACPTCHTRLEFKPQDGSTPAHFACPTCQYVRETDENETVNRVDAQPYKLEARTSFSNDPGNWPLARPVRCPHCGNDEAFYEEPVEEKGNVTFYICGNWLCGKSWREDW